MSDDSASRPQKQTDAAETIVKTQTKPTDNRPAGNAREAVRGFRASKLRSAMRLNAIAADRAPTIATTIHKNLPGRRQSVGCEHRAQKSKRQRKKRVLDLDHFQRQAGVFEYGRHGGFNPTKP